MEEVGEAVSCQVEVETHPGAAAQEEVDAQDEQRHGTQQAGQQAARRPAPGEQADARERERGLQVLRHAAHEERGLLRQGGHALRLRRDEDDQRNSDG